MSEAVSEPEFDDLSWHDNIVYAVRFDLGDASQGDWRRDLIFDIDYIAEWVSGGERGGRMAINELSIADISRTLIDDKQRFPDQDYYRWRIELNVPQDGEIVFGTRGFTQTLRAEPLLLDEQRLPAGSRREGSGG